MKNKKRKKGSWKVQILIYAVMLVPLFSILKLDAYASKESPRVLFICSYSESFITVPYEIKGVQNVFNKNHIHFDIEYMDAKRFPNEENTENFQKRLSYKLTQSEPYDAIVVADDAALQFVMDYQDRMFSGLPVVFFGINDIERAENAMKLPNMTGSIELMSIKETISLAQDMNPETKKIIAIVDDTPTGVGDRKQFEKESVSNNILEFETFNVSEGTFEEFANRLETVGEDSVFLFMSMNQDKNGVFLDLDKQFSFIKEHTKVPVYRASIGGVGEGLFGGKMISYEKLGENAANTVLKILNGKRTDEIPLVRKTPYYYLFDYHLIQKYQIDEKRIPSGAVLLNKEVSPLEKYREYFLIAGAFIAFLLILLLVLLFDNYRRRKLQKQLEANHSELAAIYEELARSKEELKGQYQLVQEHSREVSSLYQKYEIAIQSTNSAVWEWNIDTDEIEISENFDRVVKKSMERKASIYRIVDLITSPSDRDRVLEHIQNCINEKLDEINIQIPIELESEKQWILVRGKRILDQDGKDGKFSGIFLDITSMKEQEEYIEYFASHDHLTYLPNRMKFMESLDLELRKEKSGAVLLLDIDDFNSINDIMGHSFGDELLKQIADRFNRLQEPQILTARLGGDDFLILLKEVSGYEEIKLYTEKIKRVFQNSFLLSGREVFINFSMGITTFPEDSKDIEQLIMNADTAMYEVKHNGKNNYCFYHENMQHEMKSKIDMEVIIRQALKEDGFHLYYQPQIDVKTGTIVGFEALLRLKGHLAGPGVFIPVAEETGHIIAIGRWIAREAIWQIADWKQKGLGEKTVAINYSSKQLHDTGYTEYLQQLTLEYGVNASCLEIEITESILLENNKQTIEFLRELKRAGFRIALDDFGTGYSSLNYLTYLPVDKIKLDKSINDKFLEYANLNVMNSLISLVHSLNLTITAEGIEDWEKFIKLKSCNCDVIQGYLFSKPLKKEDVEEIYNENLIRLAGQNLIKSVD